MPFIPRIHPIFVCVRGHAIVGVIVPCIFLFSVIWLRPAFQSMSSVEVPPNHLNSFQLLCLIVDKLCFWPMIKCCKLFILVSLCGREPYVPQDGTVLSDQVDLFNQTLPLFFSALWVKPLRDWEFKGIVHQFFFRFSNLIFWIVMGCGIADFVRRGL